MKTEILHISYTLNTLDEAVQQFWEIARNYNLFALSGEMGAGKTTFIHHLCQYLHVADAVSSPTFALINEYHYTDAAGKDEIIYHLDWYRLKDSREAFDAGMEDCIDEALNKKARCFIEWPEKAMELLRSSYLWISIATTGMEEREMTVWLVGM
jgi:tRNA threonylcarbamoyladenosine biosynthesis protein TsaE